MKTGIIPDSVMVTYNNSPEAIKLIDGEEIKVFPAYVSNVDSKTSIENAERWAERSYDKRKSGITQKRYSNKPFSGVYLTDLEVRSQGGRAYKALLPFDALYVDLREDVLLEALMSQGAEPKNNICKLNGEYLFATVGSQMKLIRVGSPLYNELVASTELKKGGKLKTLQVGNIYSNRNGERKLFLGEFYVLTYNVDLTLSNSRGSSWYRTFELAGFKIRNPKIEKMLFFYGVPEYLELTPGEVLRDAENKYSSYHYHFIKSHSLVTDHGNFFTLSETEKIAEKAKVRIYKGLQTEFKSTRFSKTSFKSTEINEMQFTSWARTARDVIIPEWMEGHIEYD